MSLSRAVIDILRDTSNVTYTPKLLFYEALKRDIPLTYENAKKILQRLYRKGLVQRLERGQYIFSPERDTLSHSKGQKGTKLRGMSHSSRASLELRKFRNKCDKGTCHIYHRDIPLFRRMLAILTSEKMKNRTISTRDFMEGLYLSGIGNPSTKRRYLTRLVKYGILERVSRGKYRVNVDLAREYFQQGTPLGVVNVTHSPEKGHQRDTFITVSHHFRIKKPVPLTEEEYDIIASYLWIKEPIEDNINGVKVKIYPTRERDRSHGIKMEAPGAIYYITYSSKKRIAKVMIYPQGKEIWTYYAKRLFGKDFLDRAIRIGISSHFALNLDEIKKVIYEGEEIKVTINKSDFGASGDLELEDVSPEGANYFLKKIKGYAEETDILESLSRKIDEVYTRIYYLEKATDTETIEKLKDEIDTIKGELREIKAHIVEHTRAFDLILKGMYPTNMEDSKSYM